MPPLSRATFPACWQSLVLMSTPSVLPSTWYHHPRDPICHIIREMLFFTPLRLTRVKIKKRLVIKSSRSRGITGTDNYL